MLPVAMRFDTIIWTKTCIKVVKNLNVSDTGKAFLRVPNGIVLVMKNCVEKILLHQIKYAVASYKLPPTKYLWNCGICTESNSTFTARITWLLVVILKCFVHEQFLIFSATLLFILHNYHNKHR